MATCWARRRNGKTAIRTSMCERMTDAMAFDPLTLERGEEALAQCSIVGVAH